VTGAIGFSVSIYFIYKYSNSFATDEVPTIDTILSTLSDEPLGVVEVLPVHLDYQGLQRHINSAQLVVVSDLLQNHRNQRKARILVIQYVHQYWNDIDFALAVLTDVENHLDQCFIVL
jgi:hypothetical protein